MKIFINMSILLVLILLTSNCLNIKSHENISGLEPDEKGTINIIDSANNKYLGYVLSGDKYEGPPKRLWVSSSYVYEKYVVNQMFIEKHPAGVSVYKKNKNINITEYKEQDELYLTYDHYLLGIYDNFLFLLSMGNSPTYRGYIIVDLKTSEIIYEGDFIWDIGINFKKPYIIETYELVDEIDHLLNDYNGSYYHQFYFDQYSFNLKTKEKINLNNRIEIEEYL